MSTSNYLNNALFQQIFLGGIYTPPTDLAIALCTSSPNPAQDGASIPEVANSGGYTRIICDFWRIAGQVYNSVQISFPTATIDWGIITHVAVLDNATYGSGNLLFYGPISNPTDVGAGDSFVFTPNSLIFQFT